MPSRRRAGWGAALRAVWAGPPVVGQSGPPVESPRVGRGAEARHRSPPAGVTPGAPKGHQSQAARPGRAGLPARGARPGRWMPTGWPYRPLRSAWEGRDDRARTAGHAVAAADPRPARAAWRPGPAMRRPMHSDAALRDRTEPAEEWAELGCRRTALRDARTGSAEPAVVGPARSRRCWAGRSPAPRPAYAPLRPGRWPVPTAGGCRSGRYSAVLAVTAVLAVRSRAVGSADRAAITHCHPPGPPRRPAGHRRRRGRVPRQSNLLHRMRRALLLLQLSRD